jgi:hypothetical protein
MSKPREAPEPHVALAGLNLPPAPDGFEPGDLADPSGPWRRGLAELDVDGADRSGADKAYRLVRRLAWGLALVGGSVHDWRKRRDSLAAAMREANARLPALEREGRSADPALREVQNYATQISALDDLLAVAEGWTGTDTATLKARAEAAAMKRERQARIPAPPGMEENLFAAEREEAAAVAAFDAARARFEQLGAALAKELSAARAALVGALRHVEDRLGESVREMVAVNDPPFLERFPARAPDDLLALHGRGIRLDKIMSGLGAREGEGLVRFERACGPALDVVLGKLGLGPAVAPARPPRRLPVDAHNREAGIGIT